MNKEEAIEKIKNLSIERNGISSDKGNLDGVGFKDEVSAWDVICILDKIDEPQKPVVPKFVAEWIEKEKKNKSRLSHALRRVFNDSNELSLYIKQQEGDYTETIAKGWVYGYTVEQEKLYTVEIPNPNSAGGKTILFKQQNTNLVIMAMLDENINKPKYLWLTEAEIRKDFDFLWQFAKQVKQVEE